MANTMPRIKVYVRLNMNTSGDNLVGFESTASAKRWLAFTGKRATVLPCPSDTTLPFWDTYTDVKLHSTFGI